MALPMDDSLMLSMPIMHRDADALLLGRSTLDGFKGFWPTIFDNEEATPNQRTGSQLDNEIQKVVISDTLTADETEPWTSTIRIIQRDDAPSELRELEEQNGKNILIFGSRTLGTTCWQRASSMSFT